jgi:16S rRNA (adenine1518-N6/adenine1519-N6)-dimethyltransferase
MKNPYLSLAYVRLALRNLHMHPTRGMGQNFLVDPHALEQIVAAAELTSDDLVVEVGPGLGVLTWELVQRAGRVVAVELDKRLAARLREEFVPQRPPGASLTIVQADILSLPLAEVVRQAEEAQRCSSDKLPENAPYKVVANLPYTITSPLLRYFLENQPGPERLVVLVQWEVAQRITAAPGSLSMLAHAIQMYAMPEIVARVPASSFVPQPAVDSAVLRLEVRPAPAVAVDDERAFFRVIKAGFLHPRKKLSNALPSGLKAMGANTPREDAVAALAAAGVDRGRRAETLTLEEWAAVYHALHAQDYPPNA